VIAQKITGNAIEWCGGNGFVRDTGIEKYWRDSKVSSIESSPYTTSADDQIGAIYEGKLDPVADMLTLTCQAHPIFNCRRLLDGSVSLPLFRFLKLTHAEKEYGQ
jgi:hypothetical protein